MMFKKYIDRAGAEKYFPSKPFSYDEKIFHETDDEASLMCILPIGAGLTRLSKCFDEINNLENKISEDLLGN